MALTGTKPALHKWSTKMPCIVSKTGFRVAGTGAIMFGPGNKQALPKCGQRSAVHTLLRCKTVIGNKTKSRVYIGSTKLSGKRWKNDFSRIRSGEATKEKEQAVLSGQLSGLPLL